MTWRKQGTSPNRLLCFSVVMFTCQGKLCEFMPASKLASTFVLALIEEKSTLLNFLYFSTQLSLEILAKQSKTGKNMLAFHCWIIQLRESQGIPRIGFCVFSDVMFTCQGKFGDFMPASKLASTFVVALIEEKSTPLNFLHFSTQLSLKILVKQSKTAKKMLAFYCWIIQLGESKGLPRIGFCVSVM